MKILEKIVNTGKYIVGTATLLAMASGCATTATYDANQCGKNPIVNGTVTKAVKRVDDRGIEVSYLRVEKGSEKFEKMDYDGDGFSETQVYSQRHNDGSRTVVSCENDKAFMGNDGKWVKQTFEYDANGNRVDE